jgi:hypothetical protein
MFECHFLYEPRMPTGDDYRTKAAELYAKAKMEADTTIQAQLESLAMAYLRLSEQADRNAQNDITYETPRPEPSLQQQQQPQPDDEKKE